MALSHILIMLFDEHYKDVPILKGRRIVTDKFEWEQGYSKKSLDLPATERELANPDWIVTNFRNNSQS